MSRLAYYVHFYILMVSIIAGSKIGIEEEEDSSRNASLIQRDNEAFKEEIIQLINDYYKFKSFYEVPARLESKMETKTDDFEVNEDDFADEDDLLNDYYESNSNFGAYEFKSAWKPDIFLDNDSDILKEDDWSKFFEVSESQKLDFIKSREQAISDFDEFEEALNEI